MIKLDARQRADLRTLLNNPSLFLKKIEVMVLPSSNLDVPMRKAVADIAEMAIRNHLDESYLTEFEAREETKAIEKIDEQIAELQSKRSAILNGDG